jgi:hypothetical protein
MYEFGAGCPIYPTKISRNPLIDQPPNKKKSILTPDTAEYSENCVDPACSRVVSQETGKEIERI